MHKAEGCPKRDVCLSGQDLHDYMMMFAERTFVACFPGIPDTVDGLLGADADSTRQAEAAWAALRDVRPGGTVAKGLLETLNRLVPPDERCRRCPLVALEVKLLPPPDTPADT